MMELAAFAAVILLIIIGATVLRLGRFTVELDELFFFAPTVGIGVAGAAALLATQIGHFSLITVVTIAAELVFLLKFYSWFIKEPTQPEQLRAIRFASLTIVGLYLLQLTLYFLFSHVRPGPDEVWTVYNMTGTSPPDQMFSWHQAMFFADHRSYRLHPFLGDFDLYDRPHLGGYVTLFIFKLFHLPLREHAWIYPKAALRFYHCFCWLLNNLYLLGVAALFKRLFGYRGMVAAIAATALSGFFILCNAGGWLKFGAAYPLLLALALFLDRRAPLLQAAFCAISFYIHGSVLPFILGFGALQLVTGLSNWRKDPVRFRQTLIWSITCAVLIGAWFIQVRLAGSKQPLFYYYWYDAGITDAQTTSVQQLRDRFLASHSWRSLSLLPIRNIFYSIVPLSFFDYVASWRSTNAVHQFSEFASLLAGSARTSVPCALGVFSAPLVIAGLVSFLRRGAALKPLLCLYVVPTLLMALLFRKSAIFSLHIMMLYQAGALFCWSALPSGHARLLKLGLLLVACEGIVILVFADMRMVPLKGIHLHELDRIGTGALFLYVGLTVALLWYSYRAVAKFDDDPRPSMPVARTDIFGNRRLFWNLSVAVGAMAATLALNTVYCLWIYYH